MFRELMRANQGISQEECIQILKDEPRGVLAVLGDNDYPYATPIDHWYCEEDGKIYFHSSPKGHRVDAMKRHKKASLCVYDQGYLEEGQWGLNIKSVVVFGQLEIVQDHQEALDICRRLSYKYTDDTEYIESEIRNHSHVLVFALVPEHISGKLVNES